MTLLARFEKQPGDTQDFDCSYVAYLAALSDTGLSATVTADTGITVAAFMLTSGVVKSWISGGVDGTTYKVYVTLTTVGGRIKVAEYTVRIKQY